MNETIEERIDKWLWAARFYKTRNLAAEAVSGGKVHINGKRCKPSKEIKIGDLITVSKDSYTWQIRIENLTKQRRPAKEAALLYSEDEDSIAKRQQQISHDKQLAASTERKCRPNKKQRRQIHRFKSERS